MLNIFGEEEFRPITKYGIEIPDYFVSKDGRILSTRTSKSKILNPKYETIESGGYITPHVVGLRVDRSKTPELFEDYDYTISQSQQKVATINIKYHRAVMEAWKPIDENPPIPKEDWDKCPESAKQFIRDAAIIDHIDSDTMNNHVDNLQWTTPKDNEPNRKKYKVDKG